MNKKFTPDPDQRPGGAESDAGHANNEPRRPLTEGFEDPADFDTEDIGREAGGAKPVQRTRKKGPSAPKS